MSYTIKTIEGREFVFLNDARYRQAMLHVRSWSFLDARKYCVDKGYRMLQDFDGNKLADWETAAAFVYAECEL